jgi:signal transduction histidine kinase/ActR/RegA family two-component response regulator
MPYPFVRSRGGEIPAGPDSRAQRYGVLGLAITAALLLILAAQPALVPAAVALLFAAVMVGVAMVIMLLGEGRRRALVSLKESEARLQSMLEQTRSARAETEALASIGRFLGQTLDSEVVAQRIVESVRILLHLRTALLFRLEPASGDLVAVAVSGATPPPGEPAALVPAGTETAAAAVRERRPVFTADVLADPRIGQSAEAHAQVELSSYRTVLAVPLMIHDTVIGALALGDTAKREFPEAEVQLVQAFADYAALAFENARLYSDTARQRRDAEVVAELAQSARAEAETMERRLAFLVEAGEVLSSSLNYEATLMSLARLTVPYLADWCAIDMVQDDDSFSRLAVVHRDPAKDEAAGELRRRYPPAPGGAHGLPRVLQTGRSEFRPLIAESTLDVADDEHRRVLLELGLTSYMCVPLVARGRTLGAISFAYGTAGRRYSRDDLSLAEAVARRAAIAVDNARLFRDAEAASRAKDEFLATLSHELRTPLHAMLGWARMLRTGTLDEPTTARALETLERNTRLQAQLIEDLLDVSRIITGKLRIDARPVNVTSVIDAALESVRSAADAKGVHLEARTDPAAGPVSGDSDRLQQVAWNLLSNAIKFTPSGGRVQVHLEVGDGQVRIRVGDTGRGIRPDFLPHLFERFRQAEGPTARALGGLGLGLAIVRHIVELHGGTVRAESEGEGRGAMFTVELPLLAARDQAGADGTGAADRRAGFEAPDVLRGLRVLIVEDDEDARDLLTAILERCGASVTAVVSASEALAAFGRVRPQAVVSDVALPGEDGYTLIRKIRALAPEAGGRVPAIALTAHARAEDRQLALRAGFQMHVAKPIEPAEFLSVVATLARPDHS